MKVSRQYKGAILKGTYTPKVVKFYENSESCHISEILSSPLVLNMLG